MHFPPLLTLYHYETTYGVVGRGIISIIRLDCAYTLSTVKAAKPAEGASLHQNISIKILNFCPKPEVLEIDF